MDLVRGMLTISFGKVKEKVSPVHDMKVHRRNKRVTSLILTFDTKCRSEFNFTTWPLYPWGKIHQ
jgi:hypothetical protein